MANEPGFAGHLLSTSSRPQSVVYFVRPQNSPRVKIGVTTNLKQRISDLQGANHSPLVVLLVLAGDSCLEADLHSRFRRHRMHREWFRLSDEIKQFITANGGIFVPRKGARVNVRIGDEDLRLALEQSDCPCPGA